MRDILEEMRRNPRADWRIEDIKFVCERHGVPCQAPKGGGGSHYKVFHTGLLDILTIPFKRPIKPIYIRKLVAFIDAARASK